MANQVDTQILEDGHRNAIVRIAGAIDTADVSLAPAIAVSQFTGNDPNYTKLLGFRVDWLQYAVDADITLLLYWNAAAPRLIAGLADSNDLSFRSAGGLMPTTTDSGYDGSINLKTKGFTPGSQSAFSVVLTLVKLYQR